MNPGWLTASVRAARIASEADNGLSVVRAELFHFGFSNVCDD
jgi:hypothetical protein